MEYNNIGYIVRLQYPSDLKILCNTLWKSSNLQSSKHRTLKYFKVQCFEYGSFDLKILCNTCWKYSNLQFSKHYILKYFKVFMTTALLVNP